MINLIDNTYIKGQNKLLFSDIEAALEEKNAVIVYNHIKQDMNEALFIKLAKEMLNDVSLIKTYWQQGKAIANKGKLLANYLAKLGLDGQYDKIEALEMKDYQHDITLSLL